MSDARSIAILLIAIVLLGPAGSGVAYDLRTHGAITGNAFDASTRLKGYLDDVGLKPTDTFDAASVTPRRELALFENTGTAQDWMIEGAIREDDYQRNRLLESLGCTPPRNPPSQIDRPLQHFFDVQRGGSGLTVLGSQRGLPAPDWALGRQGRGSDVTQNQLSVLDARVYQLRSLTRPTRGERDRNTALLFRSLGQVIHVLQDMAQPQHTRNDPHAGCLEVLAGEHSWYEIYLERRALGERFRRRGEPSPPLRLSGYDPPRFETYDSFWATADRKGLADFSGRNFFSAGTNLPGCGGLPEPVCDAEAYIRHEAAFSFPTVDGGTIAGTVTQFLRTIQDAVTGDFIASVPVSSRSLWDQHLERQGLAPSFSLNTLNYDAMSDLLLPRAVGYSAGLLDYFFRGKLEFELVAGADETQATLVGVNRSEDPLGLGGQLTLHWEDAAGRREPVQGPWLTLGAPVGKDRPFPELTFTWPADPERPPKRFVLAYQGPLGLEAGAVVGKVVESPALEQAYQTALFDANTQQWVFPWFLRTAEGIYVLPFEDSLPGQFVNDLKWGERDNMLVVQANQDDPLTGTTFVVFELDRAEGGRAVPTTGQVRYGHPVVALHQVRAVPLTALAGLDLGTTVDLTHRHTLRQHLLVFTSTTTAHWEINPWNPTLGNYVVDSASVSEGSVQPIAPIFDATYAQSFRLVLDSEHFAGYCFDFPCPQYDWFWHDFALTASGEVLLLVGLREGGLAGARQEVPALGHVGSSDALVPVSTLSVVFRFPNDSPSPDEQKHRFAAWVNLTQRTVVAKTMSDRATLGQVTVQNVLRAEWQFVSEAIGGPFPGTTRQWSQIWPGSCANAPPDTPTIELEQGLVSLAYTGLYRDELARLGVETDFVIVPAASVTEYCFGGGARGFRLRAAANQLAPFPYRITSFGFITQSVLPGAEAVERFPLVFTRRSGEGSQLVLWNRMIGTAQRLLSVAAPGALGMAQANERWALVEGYPTVYLVSLDGAGNIEIPWADEFGRRFLDKVTLVAPDRLYDARDDTFFTPVGPELRPTKFRPAPLAAADPADAARAGAPWWPYHVVRPR
jgi:hypothetical protein